MDGRAEPADGVEVEVGSQIEANRLGSPKRFGQLPTNSCSLSILEDKKKQRLLDT